ncbi:unnamed protein product [Prunus brigantina]
MIRDSSGHGQAAATAKPKVVSRPKSLVIPGRKTSMTYESSSDEDDDEIANDLRLKKAPIKRPKRDPVIEDLPDLSSPGHSQEFIGFETEDQFNLSIDNTVIAEVNEAVATALANDNQDKHVSPFNMVEIVKDTMQEINVGTSKTTASSKTLIQVEFAQPIQDTTTLVTHETSVLQPKKVEPTIKGFMKQLAKSIHAYNQAMMEYNASQALIEKIQSTNHILPAHLHICHEGKEELDKLEEEHKKIEARKSTILAKIDNAVQDSRPHQVELEKFMQQQADFQDKEDVYKTLMSARAELWVNFKTIIQKYL